MRTLTAFIFALCATFMSYANGQAIGNVATPAKKVTASSSGISRSLSMGDSFSSSDQIVIGADERRNVQFTLTDGTLISCSPNSAFIIGSYQFQGQASDALSATLSKGGCRILAGNIDRPGSAGHTWHTPTAVMGLAGTLVGVEVQRNDTAIGFFQGKGSVRADSGQLSLGTDNRFDFASIDSNGLRGHLQEPALFDKLELVPGALDDSERVAVSPVILAEHSVKPISTEELRQLRNTLQRSGGFGDKSILKLHDPQMDLKAEGLMCD
jgi:hypothetical protein